jgi:hypothetical protein
VIHSAFLWSQLVDMVTKAADELATQPKVALMEKINAHDLKLHSSGTVFRLS